MLLLNVIVLNVVYRYFTVSIPTQEMKYLIILFLRSGKEAKHGVELRHSTRMHAFIFQCKSGECDCLNKNGIF